MKLYGYFRSSAAYRCRIALNLKGIPHDIEYIHLTKDGGQQKTDAYRKINPQALVPSLAIEGETLTQSLAIIEYLEEIHPGMPLLPKDPVTRAKIRAFALAIACEIHPVNNLRVLGYLKTTLKHDQSTVDAWYRHWVETGLAACEAMLPQATGPYCFGATPTLADVVLVPQLANARRFKSDLSACPRLVAIDAECNKLKAFADAAPAAQKDAEG
ncbi:MAG: maleylacetoacetate isomerase [Hyphomicrobiaceae bacterium]|nr:maleylacetoacetate isomerase [Hyphomicrobiaceae bacterium]